MGYRHNIEPPKPEDMLPHFSVRNGATMRLAFHCYYMQWEEGHDPHYHDFINWPAPNYHGEACQMLPPRDQPPHGPKMDYITEDVEPIELLTEGYTAVKVAFSNSDISSYLTPSGGIVESQDTLNMVRLSIGTAIPSFTGEPKSTEFTVFLVNSSGHTDELIHGVLDILPGALPPEDEDDEEEE